MEDKEPLPFSVAIASLVLSFILVYSIIHCVQRFVDIEHLFVFRVVFCASVLLSLIFDAFYYSQINKLTKGRIGTWVENNYSKLLLSYLITVFFFISITNHTIWTGDEAHDVLSLEWTIFGFSLTIFFVWNVLIVKYLQKKRPVASEKKDYLSEYEYLLKKRAFSSEIDTTFLTVVLLSINLLLLLFSSALVYISHIPDAIFTQNAIILTFYFLANTITSLFFDILKPLKQEKDALKESCKVSDKELNAALGKAFVEAFITAGIEAIQSSDELTEEQKKEGVRQYLSGMKEVFRELKEESGQGKT